MKAKRRIFAAIAGFGVLVCVLAACEVYSYGKLGGTDQTGTYEPGESAFEECMEFLSGGSADRGVWYSHYAGIGRLDGYRIGKWSDFAALMIASQKIGMFPDITVPYETYTGGTPNGDDYFVFYDDTVYGQTDDDSPATSGNWGFAYMGVVRAINFFNDDPDRGAIIIEYFEGCDPNWLWDSEGYNGGQGLARGEKPFFGIYYRVLKPDIVQMANAVDLAALYAGEHYYTETATLQEAIENNTIENEAEYISWGVVIPQDRETGQ
jgi:hypothetical protein